jgi:hypothetical protein
MFSSLTIIYEDASSATSLSACRLAIYILVKPAPVTVLNTACQSIYDKWAATYNDEVGNEAQNYVAPVLVAQAVRALTDGANISVDFRNAIHWP